MTERLLRAAGVAHWLVDTGYAVDTSPAELAELGGGTGHEVLRGGAGGGTVGVRSRLSGHSDLPVPDFDQLPLTDLRHRIRSLDERQLGTLLAHERAHGDRLPVLELLQTRLDQLADGARPSPGDPRQAPEVSGHSAGSPVQPATSAEGNTPLRHGWPGRHRPVAGHEHLRREKKSWSS